MTVASKKVPISVTAWLPRPAVKYHGCYPRGFEKYISEWLETENYIHLFSGMCKTGFKVDIKEALNPDLCCNCEKLPLDSKSFEGGMADPPYTAEFAKLLYDSDYPEWSKWTSELSRVVKVGGKIGIMQNYICPIIKNCEYEHIYFVPTRIKQFPKIVTVYRKIK